VILIGLGANLVHPEFGAPINTLAAAVAEIGKTLPVVSRSRWYSSAPVPHSDQPWFVNAVVQIKSDLSLYETLDFLHSVEKFFGRVRERKWEARVLDIDLLVFEDVITENKDQKIGPVVPHPFIQDRAFVLAPLAEIAPDWRHPVFKKRAQEMLENLPRKQEFRVLD
jgi:2-amino-4-hydroxy-6-hydroxymethyldihydropteridine diphosphokinase